MKFVLCLLFVLGSPIHGAEKPNALFIAVDDLKPVLGCDDDKTSLTAEMGHLASRGTVCTKAYVAYPRSVPSRFGIFTGKHPARVQGMKDSPHVEPDRDATIGQAFKTAG